MDLTVYWAAFGYIHVKDIRKELKLYYTECDSDRVILKIIKLDHVAARSLEQDCISDFKAMKTKVDGKVNEMAQLNAVADDPAFDDVKVSVHDEHDHDDNKEANGDQSRLMLSSILGGGDDRNIAIATQLESLIADYPNIKQLVSYNVLGTLKLLHVTKAIKLQRKFVQVMIEHENKDWQCIKAECKALIERFWFNVNPSPRLEPARIELTNEMHKNYLRTPAMRTKSFDLDKCGKYDIQNETIYFHANGFIDITNAKKQNGYYVACESDSVLLCVLFFDHGVAKKIEQLCAKDFEKAKVKVDKTSKNVKGICWDDLYNDLTE